MCREVQYTPVLLRYRPYGAAAVGLPRHTAELSAGGGTNWHGGSRVRLLEAHECERLGNLGGAIRGPTWRQVATRECRKWKTDNRR